MEESAEAIEQFERMGLQTGLAYAFKALGDVASVAGEVDVSLVAYARAQAVFTALGDERSLAYSRVASARLLLSLGQTRDAALLAAEAANIFAATGIRYGGGLSHSVLIIAGREIRARVMPANNTSHHVQSDHRRLTHDGAGRRDRPPGG